jgi:hypothetical protein
MRQVGHTSTAEESSPGLSEGVVKIIFLLLGIGILLPWNAYVNAKPYFEARFCSSDGTETINFELWFGLAWNLASVVSLGSIIVFQMAKDRQVKYNDIAEDQLSRTDESQEPLNPNNNICNSHSNQGHSFWLVMMPLSLFLAVFVFTAFLVFVPDIPPRTFTVITLFGLAICGMCGAIATAGVVSTASLFPSHVGINPFFSGQAVGGVAVSAANFVAASMEDSSSFWGQHCEGDENENSYGLQSQATCSPYQHVDWVVFAYFSLGCVVLGSCLVGYSYIVRYQRSEHRDDYEPVRDNTVHDKVDESPRIGLELKQNDRPRERQETESDIVSPHSPTSFRDDPLAGPTPIAIDAPDPLSEEPCQNPDEGNTTAAVWNAIKGPAWCIFFTFSVTLSLFPGWISQLRSSHECETHFRLHNDLYTPLSFLVFNVGDLMGRLVSAKIPVDRIRNMSHKLVVGALLRVVFFPLFLLCAAGAADRVAVTIPSDLYSLAVQLLFAFSNGILISCSFMHAPHLIANSTGIQERSSEIMTFAVSFGLLSGSLLSFPFSIISNS